MDMDRVEADEQSFSNSFFPNTASSDASQRKVKTIVLALGKRNFIPQRESKEKIILLIDHTGHHKIGEVIGSSIEVKYKKVFYWRFSVPLQAFWIDCTFSRELNTWVICPLTY